MTQPAKYKYEFGKRWDARVPRASINWLMGRVHVGTPDEEVEQFIKDRCATNPNFTPTLVRQSVRYALVIHHRNAALFVHVMNGGRK